MRINAPYLGDRCEAERITHMTHLDIFLGDEYSGSERQMVPTERWHSHDRVAIVRVLTSFVALV